MGCDGCDPVQDRKDGKVSLEGGIHLGAVKDGLAFFVVGHLLLGEGGAEDILDQTLPSMVVLTLDLDLNNIRLSPWTRRKSGHLSRPQELDKRVAY